MQNLHSANIISYRHYNLPISFPCIAFLGANWILDDNADRTKHFHNCIELGYCKSGNGTLSIENTDFPFETGDFSFIPENAAHRAQALQGTESSWDYVFFDPYLLFKNHLPEEILNGILSDLSNCFGIIYKGEDNELHFLMSCIFSEVHKKEPYYQDSLRGLFFSLLTLVTRNKLHSDLPKSDFQWLYSAISYIRRNYQRKLTIAEISEICCNLSESHFRKRFNEIMHISPLDYINHLRIRIACQLIYNNDIPINKIASEVGFSTLSSFNRNFHGLFHTSPSLWRKQYTSDKEVPEINAIEGQDVFLL